MAKLFNTVFFALTCFIFSLTAASASDIIIEEFALDNGLKVIVIPNHRVPAVSHMLWFPSGGADDPSGKSGLAHFHEHVMFKGTPNFPAGSFESIVSRLGGDHNAFTSYDTTGYYVNIPVHALPKIMELEADRIRGIIPTDDDIVKERNVIIEERRMRVDNSPSAQFSEQMDALLFVNHPYGTPLIGWQHEMEALNKDDVMTFHENYYSVNNATLILAGDITAEKAKPLVERYYGGLDARDLPKRSWNAEPPIRGTKRFVMKHERVNEPIWQRSYIGPSYNVGKKENALPLMVFAEWFAGGDTSYLYQELVVKRKVATRISSGYSPFSVGPGTAYISANPAPGVSLEKLEKEVDKALEAALNITPKAEDVARAKTLLKAETLYAREGLQGMAYIVGWMKMIGLSTSYVNEWGKHIDAVTIEQMQQAARDTYKMDGTVTGLLLPEKMEGK